MRVGDGTEDRCTRERRKLPDRGQRGEGPAAEMIGSPRDDLAGEDGEPDPVADAGEQSGERKGAGATTEGGDPRSDRVRTKSRWDQLVRPDPIGQAPSEQTYECGAERVRQ